MSDPFIGEIKPVAFNYAPYGWSLCAGQLIPISQNSALFALLGVSFGGNGVSNFNLPDLRGRVLIGAGQGPGLQPYDQGQTGGSELTALTVTNMPPHNHVITSNATANTSVTTAITNLTATTTLTALSAPTSRAASPAGNFITQPQTAGTSPAGVLAFAAPGQGTSANLANGSATTTLGGSVGATAATNVSVVSNAAMTGSGIPFANMQPFTTVTYILAMTGIFPSRQ